MSQPQDLYPRLASLHASVRERLGRGLTLAEKILYAHLADGGASDPARGQSYVDLTPDRVALQDATAQMALLQFSLTGRDQVAVPTTVHCDHLIRAHQGAAEDLSVANHENHEVYEFLKTAAARYGAGFWEPGAGIIHQVVLENYAFPGGLMIGTDSHTPNAGGLGMLAIGVGGADAMEVMADLPFGLRWPKLIGVHLTGSLDGWSSAKDVILKVLEQLTVKGGTGAIVEYFGEGTASLSATGKATICNMGAEHGATTSVFPYDEAMGRYLRATRRGDVADLADAHAAELRADDAVLAHPAQHYDEVLEIDLSALVPLIVGPHTPDRVRPLADLGAEATREGWPLELGAALIGSCTNSSYEDMERAASVARQAAEQGLTSKVPLMVSPGSNTIDDTIRRDGQMQALQSIGATVLANACGPCIGQWQREGVSKGEANSIVTSFNRNFSGRNDANTATCAFITSPEAVIALALAGRLDFDPRNDSITTSDGNEVRLSPPSGDELPSAGFVQGDRGYVAPPADGTGIELAVAPGSKRLQLLTPFEPTSAEQFRSLPVLIKVSGKCTTDHISAAGPWLRFRGHLQNISDNMLLGAHNAFTGETGKGKDLLSGESGVVLPELAKRYKAAGQGWIVVGDGNYGEGSSREHAAMCPRFLGARAVLVRSFARIHETNLKKQGVLPLTFVDPSSWERVREDDRVSIEGIDELAPGQDLTLVLEHADGSSESFAARHSMNPLQIEWFRAGSALNHLRRGDLAL
ncbi:MAG: aconitate hydratase [Planctomycetota bacterium]|nr:MAG: aconitate hydratase [Planctomycetota bacterium]